MMTRIHQAGRRSPLTHVFQQIPRGNGIAFGGWRNYLKLTQIRLLYADLHFSRYAREYIQH